jgi:predicted unusual protein kinase regulating ubiquinone biosynthesis (AarF/ABC1/UbiB family)
MVLAVTLLWVELRWGSAAAHQGGAVGVGAQVYKGRLKSGELVAVKVQRPYVVETVTIDLYIIRKLGLFLRRFPEVSTDVVALLDEWAARFFEELDYVHEGRNATLFAESMREDLPQVGARRDGQTDA